MLVGVYSLIDKVIKQTDKSVDDVIDQLFNTDNDDFLEELSDDLGQLADLSLLNKSLKFRCRYYQKTNPI